MDPTLFSYAIVRSYDRETPPTPDKEVFRYQCAQFFQDVEPFSRALTSLVMHAQVPPKNRQKLYDTLVSVAYDAGMDSIFDSAIPDVLMQRHSKRQLREAFMAIPAFSGALRADVLDMLTLYHMPVTDRRYYEYSLAEGVCYFMIGRTRVEGEIAYSPYALHPLLQWLYYR